jgi:hypothetical protein
MPRVDAICHLPGTDSRADVLSLAPESGWSFTTESAHILPLAANPQLWSIGNEVKLPIPISKSKE